MAQQPPLYGSQAQQGMPAQQNVSLQQMLSQKTGPLNNPGGMPVQQQQTSQNYANMPQAPAAEKTIIDDFEAAFQSCSAPLLPGSDNLSSVNVSPDKLRASMEHSIQQFTEQARHLEAYFLKKHATVAQQQPELVLQEEIDSLKEEISRRDVAIRNHAGRVKSWQDSLRNLQSTLINTDRGPQTPTASQNSASLPMMHHTDMVQQMTPRR